MKYLSLFSGIGGFELGIQRAYEDLSRDVGVERADEEGRQAIPDQAMPLRKRQTVPTLPRDGGRERPLVQERHRVLSLGRRAGPVCVGFSEIDRVAIQIYQRHFPTHGALGDITQLDAAELPDIGLICGGFPCQAFSLAGRRQGFRDTRGTLFFQIARLAADKGPRLLFLENVKGLLSHDGGRTFLSIITALDELGYDCQWQVLNSKDFGVPQNRERVFIVGHLRGTPRPEVFPLCGASDGAFSDDAESRLIQVNQPSHSARRTFSAVGIALTLRARSREDETGPPLLQVKRGVRRLTPVECERLQGFPDNWTALDECRCVGGDRSRHGCNAIAISDAQRYKTLGNAVTVNVIHAIATRLLHPHRTR